MNKADPTPCRATVLITTKDRKQVLVRAIESVLAQTAPLELLVVDDGSTDGTAEMVRQRFPQVRLIRNEQSLGIIAARNAAAQQASTEILFTLDDDAVYSDSLVAERVIDDMRHPRVGAVAIPLVDHVEGRRHVIDALADDPAARGQADFLCIFVYFGGANAVRRSLFLELGGYQGDGRQGEEHTYCARLLAAGYVVRVASHGHVDHFPGAVYRDRGMVIIHDIRNAMLFSWLYVPLPQLLVHAPGVVVNRFIRELNQSRIRYVLQGVLRGFPAIWRSRRERRPLSRRMYRLMRDLIKRGPLPFSTVEPRLPPPFQPSLENDVATGIKL